MELWAPTYIITGFWAHFVWEIWMEKVLPFGNFNQNKSNLPHSYWVLGRSKRYGLPRPPKVDIPDSKQWKIIGSVISWNDNPYNSVFGQSLSFIVKFRTFMSMCLTRAHYFLQFSSPNVKNHGKNPVINWVNFLRIDLIQQNQQK